MEENFGERIKQFINENNMSIAEFAKKASVKVSQVNDWMKNKAKPRCKTLIKISRALKVSTDYFLGLTDNY